MMQFKETYEQILSGQKTQTRRLVKADDYDVFKSERGNVYNIDFVTRNCRLMWRVGKTYAVQPGRGKKALGRIQITAIRKQKLRDIAGHEVAQEGFATLQDFIHTWDKLHAKSGNGWQANPDVWVLEFKTVKYPLYTARKIEYHQGQIVASFG